MTLRSFLAGALVALVPFLSACEKQPAEAGDGAARTAQADATRRCGHGIKQDKCPFCTPALIESDGFCGEHGVAEALCVQCRPYLKAAFRAKGDWCKEHEAPDSQCVRCHPELKGRVRPGEHGTPAPAGGAANADAAACEHTIARIRCPFCTPSLVKSDGFCKEHGVAEALCVTCRPDLEPAFKAKGDWCTEHQRPESQCVQCNPSLGNAPTDQREGDEP